MFILLLVAETNMETIHESTVRNSEQSYFLLQGLQSTSITHKFTFFVVPCKSNIESGIFVTSVGTKMAGAGCSQLKLAKKKVTLPVVP